MNTVTARLTLAEAAITRLAVQKGPRVGDLLRQTRARAIAGELPPPILHDLGELEAAAVRGGVVGQMARARLRLLRERHRRQSPPARPPGWRNISGGPRQGTRRAPGRVKIRWQVLSLDSPDESKVW